MITICIQQDGGLFHFTITKDNCSFISGAREDLQDIYREASKLMPRTLHKIKCGECKEEFDKYQHESFTICALCHNLAGEQL